MLSLTRIAELPQVQWTLHEGIAARCEKLAEEVREMFFEIEECNCSQALLFEFADVCIVMASMQARGQFTEEQLNTAIDKKLSKLANIAGMTQ